MNNNNKYEMLTGVIGKDVKKYNLIKTKQDKNYFLFDFSNIEKLIIDEYYKEKIKQEIKTSYCILNDFIYIVLDKNDFERCVSKVYLKGFNVYNANGKRFYRIIDISACETSIMERESIYENNYKIINNIQEKWYYTNETIDIDL